MLTTQRVTTPRDIYAVAVLAHEIWNQHFALFAEDEDGGALQLSKLYLKRPSRGRGLGRTVLAWIEEECRARGVRELWLTVNKNNADSIAFYQRIGFRHRRLDRHGHRRRIRHGRLPDGEDRCRLDVPVLAKAQVNGSESVVAGTTELPDERRPRSNRGVRDGFPKL